MNTTAVDANVLNDFPAELRDLIAAELAAGNQITELRCGFPAPPVGACVLLAQQVSTRARASDARLRFFERRHSNYSGEFTDARGFFFVLEPPRPPEPMPGLDAVRTAARAGVLAADAAAMGVVEAEAKLLRAAAAGARPEVARPPAPPESTSPRVERFRQSMTMDFERWHDGLGYDLDSLRAATAQEREQIASLLLARGVRDWRDVEALAALASPAARVALREAFSQGGDEVRLALLLHAGALFSPVEHTDALVAALRSTEVYAGLTQALLLAERWHPPEVIEALLCGVLQRDGATASSLAAALLELHGESDAAFQPALRPLVLSFQEDDREAPFRQLCARIGVDQEHCDVLWSTCGRGAR